MPNRGSTWTPIYMVVIIAIAAVLILSVIKPMFQSASGVAAQLAQFIVI
ncbi:hypothetical protein HYS54_04225 [Candidatus Micrarchaeota archaeon]|nr:hypothetical protein [Candidatus Micrarchaeota archaeon]